MKRPTNARSTPRARSAKPAAAAPSSTRPRFLPPYPPSAFDRFTAWVDRLPVPAWLAYALVALAAVTLAAALRVTGAVDRGGDYTDFVTAIQPALAFCFMHYIDRMAGAALDATRSLLHNAEDDTQVLRYRLTTLPASSVRWAIVVGAGLSLVLASAFNELFASGALTPFARVAATALGVANITLFPIFVVHSFHQLWVINDLLTRRVRADLFHIRPLYAFSILSAHTATGMLLILSGALLITPGGLTGTFLVAGFLFGALAVLTFLLPLAGLHRRLAEEKDLALAENGRRWQSSTTELYRRVDRRDWAGADRLNATQAALERSRTAIERIPAWPWRPETLRGLVAALTLPDLIWMVQFGLQKVLG